MRETYSTDAVAQRERVEYWIDAICDAYVRLGCDTEDREHFSGQIDLKAIGAAQLSVVTSSGQHVRRRRHDISRSNGEYFLMSVQLAGTGCVLQGDREAKLLPGEFALYSSIDPYELIFPGPFSQLVIQVPRDRVVSAIPVADMLTAIPVCRSNRTGQIVVRTLTDIAGSAGEGGDCASRQLENVVADLIGCGMAQIADGHAPDEKRQEMLLVLRMESFIASNLARPDLSRGDVAAGLGMSVRRLNEILAKRDTSISRCINEQRIKRIVQDFSSPAEADLPVGAIASKWGFDDAQHFSKWFRRMTGQSPREYRQQLHSTKTAEPITLG